MKLRFPWLTLSLAVLATGLHFLPGAATALQFDRTELTDGALWRGLTAHLVHFNSSHLAWDLLMLVGLGAWAEQFSRRGLALTLAASAGFISWAVWIFQPELLTYRGLSGVDCALFGYVLTHTLLRAAHQRDRTMVAVAAAAGVFFLTKTVIEFASGQALFAETHGEFVAVPLAHLVGLITGFAGRVLAHPLPPTITPYRNRREAII